MNEPATSPTLSTALAALDPAVSTNNVVDVPVYVSVPVDLVFRSAYEVVPIEKCFTSSLI